MRLYLDENVASRELARRLAVGGHVILEPSRGATDAEVWAQAQDHEAVLLTRNTADFTALAERAESHHGLLLIYAEPRGARDMREADIAAAINQVADRLGADLANRVIVLNQFR